MCCVFRFVQDISGLKMLNVLLILITSVILTHLGLSIKQLTKWLFNQV